MGWSSEHFSPGREHRWQGQQVKTPDTKQSWTLLVPAQQPCPGSWQGNTSTPTWEFPSPEWHRVSSREFEQLQRNPWEKFGFLSLHGRQHEHFIRVCVSCATSQSVATRGMRTQTQTLILVLSQKGISLCKGKVVYSKGIKKWKKPPNFWVLSLNVNMGRAGKNALTPAPGFLKTTGRADPTPAPAPHHHSSIYCKALCAAARADQGNPRPFLGQSFLHPSPQAPLRSTRPSAPGHCCAGTERNTSLNHLGIPNAWVRAAKASRFSYKLWNLNFNQAQQSGSRWDRETQHHKVFNHLYDKYLVFLLKYCNTLFWDSIKNYNRFAIRLYSRWFSTKKKELCLI